MADADQRPDTSLRPFSTWLVEQRGGALHGELAEALAEVARAVVDVQKPGTLTLTLKLKPSKVDGALTVEDEVKVKAPEPDRGAALFFPDSAGNLSRRDPRQPELPFGQPREMREASAE
jgi:hypothetical protein